MKKLLPIIFFCLLLNLAFGQRKQYWNVAVGDKAPNVTLTDLDGNATTIEDLKGKVVLIQLSARWCHVCIEEMPYIEKYIWQKNKDNPDFACYGIAYKGSLKDAHKMMELGKATYKCVYDPKGKVCFAFANVDRGMTRNVVIGKDGNVICLTFGFNLNEFLKMKKIIEEELKK